MYHENQYCSDQLIYKLPAPIALLYNKYTNFVSFFLLCQLCNLPAQFSKILEKSAHDKTVLWGSFEKGEHISHLCGLYFRQLCLQRIQCSMARL